jgi:hypothetical protein
MHSNPGVTPTLGILSAQAVWLGPIGSQQFAALRSCDAHKLGVACV